MISIQEKNQKILIKNTIYGIIPSKGCDYMAIAVPAKLLERTEKYASRIAQHSEKLSIMYKKCCLNTLETAAEYLDDGSVFVLTGDIPAMWLRDSTAEVSNYIPAAAEDEDTAAIIRGVIRKQREYIKIDPYANAFKKAPDSHREFDDYPRNLPIVWERKYEIDSLCYPIRLAYLYLKATGDKSILDDDFIETAKITVDLWITEQNHIEKSPYRFTRKRCKEKDTLVNDGLGRDVACTGMTWSGFRPSDDACRYGYLVASNMFAYVELGHLEEMLSAAGCEAELIEKVKKLRGEIYEGINKYAVVTAENGKKIFANEVDGKGNYFCYDDANVPSLLSAPYLGYCRADDEIYRNTREFILSKNNPYYYEGKYAKGVGSPHTPEGYIWHIALSMQGLTSDNPDEIRDLLKMLETTDAGTNLMHEGFKADNPDKFTRPWFSWSCSLFAELCEKAVNEGII